MQSTKKLEQQQAASVLTIESAATMNDKHVQQLKAEINIKAEINEKKIAGLEEEIRGLIINVDQPETGQEMTPPVCVFVRAGERERAIETRIESVCSWKCGRDTSTSRERRERKRTCSSNPHSKTFPVLPVRTVKSRCMYTLRSPDCQILECVIHTFTFV